MKAISMSYWIFLLLAGHHSLSGIYDQSRQVAVEGAVVEFRFINPHPFVVVQTEQGNWEMEMDNRSELIQIGMNGQSLRPGDKVAVRGNPSRSNPRALYINRLDRPADGFRYEQIGSTPRIQTVK